MFESAELGHRVDKETFERESEALRPMLLDVQGDLREAGKFPVLVLIGGVDGAGKGETVNLLNAWMDPRHIRTEAYGAIGAEESSRPEMWRFWQVLPARGHIGILFGSWYTDPILAHVMGHEKKARFAQRLDAIRHFERMLVAEGGLLIKFWVHVSKASGRKRSKSLEADALAHESEAKLRARGKAESAALRRILETQTAGITKKLEERRQGVLPFMGTDKDSRDARDQWENETAYLDERKATIARDLALEPASIEAGYEIKLRRLEPVGLVYIWPETKG